VIQLIYASRAVTPFTSDDLRAMLVRSRAHNARIGVTGMLLHVDGAFLQVLEGKSAIVHALYARIRADRRHGGILTLLVRDLEARSFGEWSMRYFDASGRGASLRGYGPEVGFADLQEDATTLGQIVEDFRDGRWGTLAA
jgi:hypothetical protein